MFGHITAVGDCNTLGAKTLEGKGYPEKVARRLGFELTNLGHTMATTREGIRLLRDNLARTDFLLIQFGLVDSFATFRYSPYVLYYPDNILRRPARSLVKKFKKTCRRTGLNAKFGQKNVVSPEEYEENIRAMVRLAEPVPVVLIDTIPHREVARNSAIEEYNRILDRICCGTPRCTKVDLYYMFKSRLNDLYQDATHCNDAGYELIADMICRKIAEKYNIFAKAHEK